MAVTAPGTDEPVPREDEWFDAVNTDLNALDTRVDAKQPSDSDLTTIAAIAPADDDFIQRKSGAWVKRTIAQVKTDLAHDHSADGTALAPVTMRQTGVHSEDLTANKNDWAIPANVFIVRFTTDASRNLTGIANGLGGRTLWLFNVGASFPLVLKRFDSGSLAAHRMLIANLADVTIRPQGSALLTYSGTDGLWLVNGP